MIQNNNGCCNNDPCSTILPGGVDVCVGQNDCKVRADVTLECVRSVLIWGTVTDCKRCPVSGALVKLFRYAGDCNQNLTEVCRTRTDSCGNYQFDLNGGSAGRYRIVVNPCIGEPNCPPLAKSSEEVYAPRENACRRFASLCECQGAGCNCIQYY